MNNKIHDIYTTGPKWVGKLMFSLLNFAHIFFSAFVVSQLWLWFLVPMGLPVISPLLFIGASLVLSEFCLNEFSLGLTVDTLMKNAIEQETLKGTGKVIPSNFWMAYVLKILVKVVLTLITWGSGYVLFLFL